MPSGHAASTVSKPDLIPSSESNLVEVEKRRLGLQEQVQRAEVSIQLCQAKRSVLLKSYSEEQIVLQKLTAEVDSLAQRINGSLLEQHLDTLRYIDAELSQLRSFQNIINELVQNKRVQLTAIHCELEDRLKRTSLQVDDILRTTQGLSQEIQLSEDISNVIQDNEIPNGSEKAIVVGDDILRARSMRESKANFDRVDEIKRLNRSRLQVIDDLKTLQARKRPEDHSNADNKSGITDILAAGNSERRDNHCDLDAVVAKVRQGYTEAKANVEQHRAELMKDLQRLHRLQRPSELTIMSKGLSDKQALFTDIRQHLVEVILPPIITNIVAESLTLDEINEKELSLQLQQNLQTEKKTVLFLQLATFDIWEEFFHKFINDFTSSIVLDAITLYSAMNDVWKSQCMKVSKIRISGNFDFVVDELIRFRGLYPNRHLLYQEKITYFKEQNQNAPNQSNGWSIFKRRKVNEEFAANSKSSSAEQESGLVNSDDVEDIKVLYANYSSHFEAASQSYSEFETEYCKNLSFVPRIVSGKGKTGYAMGRESRDGTLLLLAGCDGSVVLLNTEIDAEENNVELLLASVRNRKWQCIDSGPWSLMNQVIVLSEQNQVYVFDRPLSRTSGTDKPYELTSEDIKGVFTGATDDKNSQPNLVAVHPAVTTNLTSMSFMIGFTSGEIIRWNRITSGQQTLIGDFPPERPTLSAKHSAKSPPSKNYRRQRYLGHQSPILMMGFFGYSNRPDNLISVDADGMIIIWDDELISGFGYICPRARYQIKVVDVWYEGCVEPQSKIIYSDPIGPSWVDSRIYDQEIRRQLLSADYIELDYGVFYPSISNKDQRFQHTLTYDDETKRLLRHTKSLINTCHIAGKVLEAKMTISHREIVVLTWIPRHQDKVAQLAFFLINFSETQAASLSGPIIRYNYEGETEPSYNNSSMIWQITQVYTSVGTDCLLTLPAMSNIIQVISTVSGSLLQKISLQTSISMIPKEILLFDNSKQIAVIYMKTSTVDIWRIINKNQPSQKTSFRSHPSKQTERVKRTPNEQASNLSSVGRAFGYLGKKPNHYFHVSRKVRAFILKLTEQIVIGNGLLPPEHEPSR